MSDEFKKFDELIPTDFTGDEPVGGSLQGLEEYQRYEVDEKKKTLESQSTKLVKSLIKLYFDSELITEDDHLKAIADIETANLYGLLESARYAQHAVSTLMRKIDAGLHADLAVYPILMELQKNSLDIQMKVAQYSRTLSPYLRSLKEDIEEAGNETIEILSRVESDSLDRKEENELGSDNFRGSLALNEYFLDRMEEIEKGKQEREEQDNNEIASKDYTAFEEEAGNRNKTHEEE